MSEVNKFAAPWTIFTHNKLKISGEEWKDNKGNRPSLSFRVVNNNPRFLVYMNDLKKTKPIPYVLDSYIFGDICAIVRHVVQDKKPSRWTFVIKSGYDHRGNKTEKVAPVAKIFVGRDSDNAVYIAFQAKDEALTKFPFTPSYYAEIQDAAGEKITKEFGSELRALSWANTLEQISNMYLVVHGKEPKEKPGNGKTTGSWGKKESVSVSDDEWDADIDF